MASPLVIHALEEHGGAKPQMLALVDKLEPSALYRAARESVKIAKMPPGPTSMNCCQEWGAPRMPVVSVMGEGGDGEEQGTLIPDQSGVHNPRVEWTLNIMEKVREGKLKRVKLTDPWGEGARVSGPETRACHKNRSKVTALGARLSQPGREPDWN